MMASNCSREMYLRCNRLRGHAVPGVVRKLDVIVVPGEEGVALLPVPEMVMST